MAALSHLEAGDVAGPTTTCDEHIVESELNNVRPVELFFQNWSYMSKSSRNSLTRIGVQTAGLALAVPQVVAHRVNRMMTTGSTPSVRDLREFHLMGSEKTAAFTEAWMAMGAYMMNANQQLAMTLMSSWWNAWFGMTPFRWPAHQLQSSALGLLAAGMAPVHRVAVANAKRLAAIKR